MTTQQRTETATKPAQATAAAAKPASANPLAVIKAQVIDSKTLPREYGRLKSNDDLHWSQEKLFFFSIVEKNEMLQKATVASLQSAFLQAASLGLSFNPQRAHVYLIPRRARRKEDGESWDDYNRDVPYMAYASPGYRGLIHLAILGGAIKFARAEIVCEKDHFRYFGPAQRVEFEAGGLGSGGSFNAFNVKRGEKVGVFCEVQLNDGTWLSGSMDKETVMRIKSKSEFPKSMLWTTFEEEGWKKALLRRDYKTWPGTLNAALFQRAIEVLNEHEGIDTRNAIDAETVTTVEEPQVTELHAMVTDAGLTSEQADKWLLSLAKTFGRTKITDLPINQFAEAKDKLQAKLNERAKKKADAADAGRK